MPLSWAALTYCRIFFFAKLGTNHFDPTKDEKVALAIGERAGVYIELPSRSLSGASKNMYRMGFGGLRMAGGGVSPPVMIIVNADDFGGAPGFLVSTVVSQPACRKGWRAASRASIVPVTGSLRYPYVRTATEKPASSRGEILTGRELGLGPGDRES